MKELYPEATVYCFYMDLRMFGRKYEDLYRTPSVNMDVFVGGVSEVSEDIDGRLVVKAEDTSGKPIRYYGPACIIRYVPCGEP